MPITTAPEPLFEMEVGRLNPFVVHRSELPNIQVFACDIAEANGLPIRYDEQGYEYVDSSDMHPGDELVLSRTT